MLDRSQIPHPGNKPPKPSHLPRTWLAKWPPDDEDLPAGPPAPAGAGGGGIADDGNFKRGRVGPIAIVLAIVLAGGFGAFMYLGAKSEGEKMTVDQISKEKKNIFVLPVKDQIPRWRTWAASTEPMLEQEALIQLAWNDDPEGVALATKAAQSSDTRVVGVAAQVLAHYGSPKADGAKPVLLEALKTADDSDRPQIVWALVTLKEKAVFPQAMDLYRSGKLSKVERMGGGSAFDTDTLSGLVSLDELAAQAGDPSPSVRQLVATVISRNAEPKWTPTLVKLVKDPDPEVGREAANGLGRIADESARQPLLEALKNADKDSRQKFLEALRDGIGGEGLVLALDSIKSDAPEEVQWFQTKQIFEMLAELADPRAADALVKWVETKKPGMHWVGEVGQRLAEVGDVRAGKYLGERMKHDPSKIYQLAKFWQADKGGHLSKGDLARVISARMLADLAVMHPEAKVELKAAAEDSVLAWAKDKPQPHANALRFLAATSSEKVLPDMRDWAFPKKELPKEGAQPPFPSEYETAQSALRYIGWMKDEPSFTKLTDQFKRKKDRKLDITQAGLDGAGYAMLGMALRAVGYGAAQGLAQWGDPRAIKPLMDFIEDETWHEEARQAACEALAWCADDKTMMEVAKKAKDFASKKTPKGEVDKPKQVIGACYASTLALRPVPAAVPGFVDLLTPDLDLGVRMTFARAIGVSGFDAANEAKLFEKLKDAETRNAAALALIMGGTTDTASRTVAMFADFSKDALDDLKDHYYRAYGFWSDEDLKKGNLYRWVANANAIAHVKVNEVPQDWARQRLTAQFDNLTFDNGPHSETRVVLRYRLVNAAKSGDAATKKGAIETLLFMKEKGALMALRHEKGDTGELAKQAFHDLMNPKLIMAEDLSKLAPPDKKSKPTP